VFTARYALSPYIKQARLVFKGLIQRISKCGTRRVVFWFATLFGMFRDVNGVTEISSVCLNEKKTDMKCL
jgi:hypothetical protein